MSAAMTPTRFRALREHLGLPVAYAAGALGVSTRTLSRWECGDTQLPAHASEWLQGWVDLTEAQIAFAIANIADANTIAKANLQPGSVAGKNRADPGHSRVCLHSSAGQYARAHRGGFLDHLWWNRAMTRVAAITGAELEYEACQIPDPPRRAMAPACDADVE